MTVTRTPRLALHAMACAGLLLSAGCTTFLPDAGFASVQSALRERASPEPRWVRNERDESEVGKTVERLLAKPLTADAAVQIALVTNRSLQATYAELGIAEADLVQAGRMRNPGFSYARLRRGDELEIERAFIFDVLGLLTIPLRTRIERRRFEVTKARVAADALKVALDTRRAYYRAV